MKFHVWGLIFIVLIVATIRVGVSFEQEHVDYSAYNVLKDVREIKESASPLYFDDLSYGGRERIVNFVYAYFLSALSLFLPEELVIKVIPNVFAALVVLPVFYLSKLITKDDIISLVSALVAGFLPATFLVGVNDGSAFTLSMLLLFTAVYFFIKSNRSTKHLGYLIATLVLLTLVSPMGSLLMLALLLYLSFLKLERMRVTQKESEITLFFGLLTLWYLFLVYKRAFLDHGASVIWQNLPRGEVASSFSQLTVFEAIISVGLLPLVGAAVGVYVAFSYQKRKSVFLLSSLGVISLALLFLQWVPLREGLYVLSLCLVIISSFSLRLFKEFIEKTKAHMYYGYALLGFVVLFFVFTLPIISALEFDDAPASSDVEVMLWAKDNVDDNAVVMASPGEGFFISYVGNKEVVLDDNYLLVFRSEERYSDVLELYGAVFKTQAIGIMQKYGATHFLYSMKGMEFSGKEELQFIDENCFELVYSSSSSLLYERTCFLGDADEV